MNKAPCCSGMQCQDCLGMGHGKDMLGFLINGKVKFYHTSERSGNSCQMIGDYTDFVWLYNMSAYNKAIRNAIFQIYTNVHICACTTS